METKKRIPNAEETLLSQLIFRFTPYWPVFLVLFLLAGAGAYAYMRFATPKYDISATVLIKDEKKGSTDSKMLQSINLFASNDIVENEMEVLHSQELMTDVVMKLNLYAPVSFEKPLGSASAYTSSPVVVLVKDQRVLDTATGKSKVYFTYDGSRSLVKAEGKQCPLDQWVTLSCGTVKFSRNPDYEAGVPGTYFFSLFSPKIVASWLVDGLEVSQPNKLSTIVKLSMEDESPKRGEDILNELISSYNLASIEDNNAYSSKTISIVSDKLASVQHQVDSIQALINQYKEQNGIVNLSEQSTQFLQTVGDNDQKIADINNQIEVLADVEKYVNSKDDNSTTLLPSTLGANDPVLANLLQRLYDLQINYQRSKMTATENNPTMVSLRNDIDKTKADVLDNVRMQKITLNTSRNNFASTSNNYSSKLKDVPEKERKLIEISRQLTALNSTYDYLLQKKEEASLANASTLANSRTIDKAQASVLPTSPKKLIVYAIALFLAIGFGSLIIAWKEFFTTKILFRSDIEKFTAIPVLGEIINVKGKKDRLMSDNQKKTIINEQFRQLAASAGFFGRNGVKRKILVTSSISGEGKSFVSTNLALCLATAGKKVILLDLDFRNPRISEMFNLTTEIGVSDFLEGGRESYEIIKHPSDHENLFVAGAGTVEPERTNALLLNDNKLKELFDYLQEVFDFVILDTAPVEPISDAFIVNEYCDCSLYVVRHKYTPKSIIKLLDKNNRIDHLKNLSIVFNAVKPRGFTKQVYGYGYGFSYGYDYNQKRKNKKVTAER